ncbi:hypothetical protein IMZ48_37185 [Candidatus Bathyarchaeota archaeon]|nr:hypothetical protein [Candidatus Bathyarchaeota archaeon]
MNLLPRDEPPRRDWFDMGWGAECTCGGAGGGAGTLWKRVFSGDELEGPTPFDFVGREAETCGCEFYLRIGAAAFYEETYGLEV